MKQNVQIMKILIVRFFCTDPRIVYCTAITGKTVFIDGVVHDDNSGAEDDSTKIITIVIDLNVQVIAIEGRTDDVTVAGIIVSTNDDFIVTDISWKCTNVKISGWMGIDFDDSAWPPAEVTDNDLAMYPRDKKFGKRAKSIWTAKQSGAYDKIVYCRAFFGKSAPVESDKKLIKAECRVYSSLYADIIIKSNYSSISDPFEYCWPLSLVMQKSEDVLQSRVLMIAYV